jgi:aryl-alcohol dehydrogenase-like predicted oxidoreductase
MQTRPLGRTGIQVSAYTLGTMMFGPYGNPDPDDWRHHRTRTPVRDGA